MRVLLIHRFFWPDTPPYASMLRSIGKRLVKDGHDVTVFSSQPSYKKTYSTENQPACENIDGLSVKRVSLFREANRSVAYRILNMIYFPLRILLCIALGRKYDIVMASTAPPVVVGFAAALGSKLRGGEFFYHCMDIHPEIGALSGEFSNPLVFRVLRAIDTYSCNVAKHVIVLSSDMKKSLEDRPGIRKGNITVINNFSMPEHDQATPTDSSLLKRNGKFRVLFAGNIGRFQGLDVYIKAMAMLVAWSDIELVFLGEGNALLSLQKQSQGLPNVKFIGHQSVGVARTIMRDADLGIVSLNKDIYRYAYPSKTMTYLDEGCPLLVSVEKESNLVSFLDEHQIGVSVDGGSPESIADVIVELWGDKDRQMRMKENAKKVSEVIFSEKVVLNQWSEIFGGDER